MEFDLSSFTLKYAPDSSPKFIYNKFTVRLLEQIAGFSKLKQIYPTLLQTQNAQEFIECYFKTLNINIYCRQEDIAHIPRTGPAIIVANHPSTIDGPLLLSLLYSIRTDIKIFGNYQYLQIPQLKNAVIGIDPYLKNNTISKRNLTSMKEAMDCLHQDNLLVIFPSGDISSFNLKKLRVIDPPWHSTVGSLIKRLQVPVVPVLFILKNSLKYQIARMIHPHLGSLLNLREFLNKNNKTAEIRIGKLIPYENLSPMENSAIMNFLYKTTYALGQ